MGRHPLRHGDGRRVWERKARLHRKDGPAVEDADGYKAWYENGSELSSAPVRAEWPGPREQGPKDDKGNESFNYRLVW